jgi:hypothetical protein
VFARVCGQVFRDVMNSLAVLEEGGTIGEITVIVHLQLRFTDSNISVVCSVV